MHDSLSTPASDVQDQSGLQPVLPPDAPGPAPSNAAVFIDYENVYRALLAEHKNVLRLGFFEKLRQWCAQHNRRVVRVVVYCNFDIPDLHESYHQSVLQSYGVETVHTSNQGKNYADLKLTIDVLASMYSNDNIDEFFIMSNDKDMTPLLNIIRENKRSVTVITTGTAYNPAIRQFADHHVSLEEICSGEVGGSTVLDTIAENYWSRFVEFVTRQLEFSTDPAEFKHCGLDYVLASQIRHAKVMKYELATIIRELQMKGQIFFYYYMYRDDPYIAFAPTDRKQQMLDMGLLREEDLIPDFDMTARIHDLYEDAR